MAVPTLTVSGEACIIQFGDICHIDSFNIFIPNSSKFWSHDEIRYMPPPVYKRKYFTYYAAGGKKTVDCRMPGCGKTVDWDRSKISAHFESVHLGVNLRSYYEQHVQNREVNNLSNLNYGASDSLKM